MKLVRQKLAVLLRMSAVAGLLFTGQQAFAVGTDAGTPIDNTAVISYDVNGNGQTPINAAAPQFLVDRVVNFTLVPADDTTLTDVELNQTGDVIFTITNLGNSPLDFALVADNLTAGATFGNGPFTDAVQMASYATFAANGNNDGTVAPNPATDLAFVDALPEGASRQILVRGTAPATGNDGEIAGFDLTATAASPGAGINPAADGVLGAVLDDALNTGANNFIDVVFDEDGPGVGGDGEQIAEDGFSLSSAALAIAKAFTVISDPVNGTTSPLSIPGAIIEYTVTITNNGSVTATNLSIGDDIQTDLNIQTAVADFAGEDVRIEFTDFSAGPSTSTNDCTFGDPECSLSVGTGPGGADQLTVTVPDLEASDSVVVRFRVEIDNT